MEISTNEEFATLINSGTIENLIINITIDVLTIEESLLLTDSVYIKNCILNFHQLIFLNIQKPDFSISFEHCEINGHLKFHISELKALHFYDLKKMESISIIGISPQKAKLKFLTWIDGLMEYPRYILSGRFTISSCIFAEQINIQYIQLHEGSFSFYNNHVLKDCRTTITNSVFNLPVILGNNFESKVDFSGCHFPNANMDYNDPEVRKDHSTGFMRDNIFQEVDFSGANFYNASKIFSCDFRGRTYFEKIGYHDRTFLIFEECEFGGTSYFDSAHINILHFVKCNFDKRVSFTNAKLNKLFFTNIKFDKPAYFDNINIENLRNESFLKSSEEEFDYWKITIRTIKQELLKVNSRFDYNKFKNYETAAYYQELKWKGGFKDKTILWATKNVTGFEHSWSKALGFTLKATFIFFSLFFISEKYYLPIDLREWQSFLSGCIRFLILTDFYSPVADGRTYIDSTNTIGWFLFILGKIVIAFGIYEMIQAFRKFKA